MLALVDVLDHPWHQGLSHDKNPDGPTLYRAVAATTPGIVAMHVTHMMWQTGTAAVDSLLALLHVGDEPPDVDLRAA